MYTIYCTNKGCGKYQQPKLDLSTNEVICSSCNKEIDNISPFTKSSMKSLGQTIAAHQKSVAGKKPFAMKCESCEKMEVPKLVANKAYCAICNAYMSNVSAPFIQMLKIKAKQGFDE